MSEEMKLKPCPFCGGEAKLRNPGLAAHYAKCQKCRVHTKSNKCEHDAIAAWNRRTPEPGTSVVRWVRYTGETETLPEPREAIILARKHERDEAYFDGEYWNIIGGSFCEPEIGDRWAYRPEPPEGMG